MSVKKAIEQASEGDVIRVTGRSSEERIMINKRVTIEGDYKGRVGAVTITSAGVRLENLNTGDIIIQHSGETSMAHCFVRGDIKATHRATLNISGCYLTGQVTGNLRLRGINNNQNITTQTDTAGTCDKCRINVTSSFLLGLVWNRFKGGVYCQKCLRLYCYHCSTSNCKEDGCNQCRSIF